MSILKIIERNIYNIAQMRYNNKCKEDIKTKGVIEMSKKQNTLK
nr:MAG: hypothetical protein [Bacteriophage sp.]